MEVPTVVPYFPQQLVSTVGPVYPSGVQLEVLATPSGAPLQSDHVIHKDEWHEKIMLISALLFAYSLAMMVICCRYKNKPP
jgi:hypothetical protein